MNSAHQIFAVALVLVVMISEGWALNCIQCNSESQPECAKDPSQYSFECGHDDPAGAKRNYTSCRKMVQEIYYDDDYQERTIRQCAVESGPMKCIERTGTYRFKVHYCHCDSDNCNGASALSVSVILSLLLASVAAYFKC